MKIRILVTFFLAALVSTSAMADSTNTKPAQSQVTKPTHAIEEASPATDEGRFPWGIVMAGGAIVVSLIALSLARKKRED